MNIKKLWIISADQRRGWRPLVSDSELCYDGKTTKNIKSSLKPTKAPTAFYPFVKTMLDQRNRHSYKNPVFTGSCNALNHAALVVQAIQPVIKSESLFLKQRLLS